MKKRLLIGALAAGFLLLLCATPAIFDRAFKAAMSGPVHTSQIQDAPPFLSESLAYAKAREDLDLDGLNSNDWIAQEDDRSEAPDGTRDKYLVRNTVNPDSGRIDFVRRDSGGRRIVRIELRGDVVEFQVWRPK